MARNDVTINILGDAKGFTQATEDANSSLSRLGKGVGLAAAGFAGIGIAAGVGLAKVGEEFDNAYDSIRTATGATGDELDGLQQSFDDVLASGPSSFEDVSTAIGDLNQRLGLTGQPLEDLSSQFLDLSRITGTDVGTNIESMTQTMVKWGVPAGEMSAHLDEMFRASQASGIGMDELSTTMTRFAAPMQQLGFSFEETAALLAGFEVSGVNTQQVMSGMRAGLVNMAKEGEAPVETLQRVTDQIAGMQDPTEATALAVELFGSRAGPEMAAAIRSGQFNLEEYLGVIENGESTIAGTADATDDWREKLNTLKNRVLVKLKPVAEAVFSAITTAAEKLSAWVEDNWPKLVAAFGWFADHKDVVIAAAAGIAAVLVAAFTAWAVSAGAAALATAAALAPIIAIGVAIAALAAGIVYAYQHFEAFRNVVDGVAHFLRDVVWPAIQAFFDLLVEGGKAVVQWFKDHWGEIKGYLSSAFDAIVGFVTPIFQAIKGLVDGVVTWIQQHWGQIKGIASQAWAGISEVVGAAVALVKGVIEGIVTFVTDTFKVVGDLIHGDWSKAWDDFKTLISNAWDSITKVVDLYVEYLKTIISNAWPIIKLAAQAAWDGIKALIKKAWDGIQLIAGAALKWLEDHIGVAWDFIKLAADIAWAWIKKVISDVWEAIKVTVKGYLEDLKLGISNAWESIKATASLLWTAIKDVIALVWEAIKATVKGYYEDLKLGISNAWTSIKATAGIIWTSIKTTISDVWEGIKTTVSDAVTAVIGFVGSIPGALEGMVGAFLSAGTALGSAIIDGLGDGLSSTAGFLGDIGSAVTQAIRAAWNAVVGRINNALEVQIPLPFGASFTVNPPDIPQMHSGGVVPGSSSDEMLAILQGGETVFTADQTRALGSMTRGSRSVRDVHLHNYNLTMTPADLAGAIAAAGLS